MQNFWDTLYIYYWQSVFDRTAGILTCLHTCRGQRSTLGKFFFCSTTHHCYVICKNRIVSCYTFTKIHKCADARRPAWPNRNGAILQYMPCRRRRDLKLPDDSTAPPTGPTDRASEATICETPPPEVASNPHNLAAYFHRKHQIIISFVAWFFSCMLYSPCYLVHILCAIGWASMDVSTVHLKKRRGYTPGSRECVWGGGGYPTFPRRRRPWLPEWCHCVRLFHTSPMMCNMIYLNSPEELEYVKIFLVL